MQVMSTRQNMLRTMIRFASIDGIPSLWWGISASMLRQSTYSTARFGLYNYFAGIARERTGQRRLPSSWEIVCAGAAGGLAGLIGNPTEVALVRMCADGARSPGQRFGYNHAIDAIVRIGREEGLRTFSRGLGPNVVRSVIMNVSQIATYSAAKRQILSNPSLGLKDGIFTHFLASLLAGTVATTACAPADVLKSRIQNAVAVDGAKPSVRKIVAESLRNEGPGFLVRGWTPAWLRLAPNTVLTFVFIEQLQKLVNLSRDMKSVETAPDVVPTRVATQKI
ncbi:Mitochondrial dicarboxylate transporter [Fonsecaea pedrosoi]|nr:Mitochondrial dicarboxylate transporter [Fonsecaea pedrosoi]